MDRSENLRAVLQKPWKATPRADGCAYEEDEFNPWDLFPSVYGTYSSEFDDLAIEVLIDVRDMTHSRDDLAAEIFREMLCNAGLCEYGTSPRVCFWELDKGLLDALIKRWREWRKRQWEDPED